MKTRHKVTKAEYVPAYTLIAARPRWKLTLECGNVVYRDCTSKRYSHGPKKAAPKWIMHDCSLCQRKAREASTHEA